MPVNEERVPVRKRVREMIAANRPAPRDAQRGGGGAGDGIGFVIVPTRATNGGVSIKYVELSFSRLGGLWRKKTATTSSFS